MDCLKQLTLTPSEFRAVMYLLTTGMGQICTSTYADTVTQLERVMKDLRELNPEAQILVLSYNNPVPLMPSWSRHFRRLNTAAAKLGSVNQGSRRDLPLLSIPIYHSVSVR